MYAVVRTGGKQVRVAPGDAVRVEKLEGNVGDRVELSEVLLVAGEGDAFVEAAARQHQALEGGAFVVGQLAAGVGVDQVDFGGEHRGVGVVVGEHLDFHRLGGVVVEAAEQIEAEVAAGFVGVVENGHLDPLNRGPFRRASLGGDI